MAAAAVAPLALTAFADLLVASRLFNLPQEAPESCHQVQPFVAVANTQQTSTLHLHAHSNLPQG